MKPVLQSQGGECGLACLAMVAEVLGSRIDLATLRRRFSVSLKGASLKELISHASALGMEGRPLRLDLHELSELSTPSILHWRLNHFVVLERVRGKRITIIDPAVGRRTLSIEEVSQYFTGVALELSAGANFQSEIVPRISVRQLIGKVFGLRRSLIQIIIVAIVLEIFVTIGPFFNQIVVDEVLTSGDHDLLTVLICGFGLLLIAQTAISHARSWMVMVLGQNISLQWMGNVFAHLIRLPVVFFETRHVGDVVSRFSAVQVIQKTLMTGATEALLDGIMVLMTLILMFVYAPPLAWITVGAVFLYA